MPDLGYHHPRDSEQVALMDDSGNDKEIGNET